ncbi:unnamed protein product [Linum tenue]|uniref:Uncharacterized protein n=1 Tax=Linum tenue TaxID=586396 RepID=A0AAV0KM12_9ROSI|nr:unnamed protein product [Linum tenue]
MDLPLLQVSFLVLLDSDQWRTRGESAEETRIRQHNHRNFLLPHQLPWNPRILHLSRNPNHKTPPEIPLLHLRFLPLPPLPPSNEEEPPLWSSTLWISKLNSFTKFFSDLQCPGLLLNHPCILYLSK